MRAPARGNGGWCAAASVDFRQRPARGAFVNDFTGAEAGRAFAGGVVQASGCDRQRAWRATLDGPPARSRRFSEPAGTCARQ
ncbi:hypothetical protein WT01_06990 [Burkholderia cepacia]|nr:hypothetical protein WS88_07305 [Burkholderia cepacia]KVL63140.1 hypothetical protein WT01_06990 [Burkholderia cepacia]